METARFTKLSLFSLLFLTICLQALPAVAQTTSTWSGGAGIWAPCPNTGGNALWDTCNNSTPAYPDGNFNAVVDGGPVTLGQFNGISVVNLTVGSGESVVITPGFLNITGSGIANSGTINIGASNGLGIQGTTTVTLSGSGSVTLSDANAHFYGANGSPTLINQQTIQGQGFLALGLNLMNQSLINANAGTLSLQPTAATNTGTMQASTGSILAFTNGTATPYNNTGGTIQALDGGTVQLEDGVYTGGTLTTVGSGVIQLSGAAVVNALTNSGTLQVLTANDATLENAINNTNVIQVPSANLFMSGNVTLSGPGSLILSGSSSLRQLSGTDTLTNQQLIHGSGTIFHLPLTNKGTVAADVSANTLALSSGVVSNTATLEATGGGTLEVDTKVNNSGGKITALGGSTVILTSNASINGGTLSTTGTGTIQSQNAVLDGTVNIPTNAGKLMVHNFDLFLQGTINNTGTIAVSGTNCVILNQPTTLTGTGKLTMTSASCIFGAGIPLTNHSTIVGAGSIGDSNPMPITNLGTITANQTSPLAIVPDASGFTNSGVLSVAANARMNINGLFNNVSNTGTLTGGTYTVAGTLAIQNSVVTNAAKITLTGAAAQIFSNNTSANALAALTGNATTGSLTLQSGQVLTTSTNLSNAGKITVKTGSGLTLAGSFMQTAGTTTVDGTLTAPTGVNVQKGFLMGQGTIAAAVASSGTVVAGDSTSKAGKLTVTGSYTQNSTGVLDVAIGGTAVGTQYSQVAVSNGISLGGTLNIKRINSFLPAIGQSFTILTGSAVGSQFATVNGTSINSTEHFQVNYNRSAVPPTVTVSVVSGP